MNHPEKFDAGAGCSLAPDELHYKIHPALVACEFDFNKSVPKV
jgi:hypothetical protein